MREKTLTYLAKEYKTKHKLEEKDMNTNIENEIKTFTEHRNKLLRDLTVVRIRYANEVVRDKFIEDEK